MIVGRDPKDIMEAIQSIYAVKSIGPPNYHLGNNYKKDGKGQWSIQCKK
jgi:hypothetical protein